MSDRLLTRDQEKRGNSLLDNDNYLAERVGFEPTLPFRVNLISSPVHLPFYRLLRQPTARANRELYSRCLPVVASCGQ